MLDRPTVTSNLASEYYADPAIFAAERRTIFAQSWQLVCAQDRLATPGAYFATRIAGVGVYFMRGEDGEIRGFRNSCRHRGAQLLAEGEGNCAIVRCPYHDWRYDERGTLLDTPWFGEASPFELGNLPLDQISVTLWRGLVFAALAPECELADQLGDLPDEVANVPLETFNTVEVQSFDADDVNWKAYFDQYTENYHVPRVHAPDKSVAIWNYTVTDRDNIVVLAAPADGMVFGGRWIWGWPNWTLALFKGGMKLSRVEPTSTRSFQIHYQYLFEDVSDGTADHRRRVIDATEAIFRDDVAASQRAQINYDSGNYTPGPMHPVLENGVAYFQKRVRETLDQDRPYRSGR